jgi:hypothetical protein
MKTSCFGMLVLMHTHTHTCNTTKIYDNITSATGKCINPEKIAIYEIYVNNASACATCHTTKINHNTVSATGRCINLEQSGKIKI